MLQFPKIIQIVYNIISWIRVTIFDLPSVLFWNNLQLHIILIGVIISHDLLLQKVGLFIINHLSLTQILQFLVRF